MAETISEYTSRVDKRMDQIEAATKTLQDGLINVGAEVRKIQDELGAIRVGIDANQNSVSVANDRLQTHDYEIVELKNLVENLQSTVRNLRDKYEASQKV